jgi:hypothetical protein
VPEHFRSHIKGKIQKSMFFSKEQNKINKRKKKSVNKKKNKNLKKDEDTDKEDKSEGIIDESVSVKI